MIDWGQHGEKLGEYVHLIKNIERVTIDVFCKDAGVSTSVFTNVMSGKKCNPASLEAIARGLGFVNAESLIEAAGIRNEERERAVIADAQNRVLEDQHLTHLPSLFETNQRLPVADAYVELQLSSERNITPNASQLKTYKTKLVQLEAEDRACYAQRLSAQEALDSCHLPRSLILGAPGFGKSSLLRRIALDIADGQWETYKVPLFIEARLYWIAKQQRPNLSLWQYGLDRIYDTYSPPTELQTSQNKSYLENTLSNQCVLLVDGLDEISGNKRAVETIYNQLQQGNFNWIATSRPAGLMRSPNENSRFELMGLDDEAIGLLIENWLRASLPNEPTEKRTIDLTVEILSSQSMAQMARNPFLLTALTFLKSQNFNAALPPNKVGLYENLISNIAHQAKRRHGDNNILSAKIQTQLAAFCLHLFSQTNGPIQIFNEFHWEEFSPNQSFTKFIENCVLPARLLAKQSGLVDHYHFLHLSLQEHLVGRAMVTQAGDMLDRQYIPAWRNAFISYASLLWYHNFDTEFKRLVQTIHKNCDVAGFQHILLANIFAACGIRDTVPYIGDDLREVLNTYCSARYSSHDYFMIQAIREMDSEWLTDQALSESKSEEIHYIKNSEDQYYEGEEFVGEGASLDCPYYILAKTRTLFARKRLKTVFWDQDQIQALLSAHGFAQIASRQERKDIVIKALELKMENPFFIRAFGFCEAAHSPICLPFLMKCTQTEWWDDDNMRAKILMAIKNSGSSRSYEGFETLAQRAIREDLIVPHLEDIIAHLSQAGGSLAIKILDDLLQLDINDEVASMIQRYRLVAGAIDNDAILEALENGSISITLAALSGAANNHILPSQKILAYISNLDPSLCTNCLGSLAYIEEVKLFLGNNTHSLCPLILKICKIIRKNSPNILDEPEEEFHRNLREAFNIFKEAKYSDALPFALWVVNTFQDKDLFIHNNSGVYETAIEYIGYIKKGTHDECTLRTLENILATDEVEAHSYAYFAIGQISPERLNLLSGHSLAYNAIENLAGEYDWLFFDDFWCDEKGEKHNFLVKPKFIRYFFIADDGTSEELALRLQNILSLNYIGVHIASNNTADGAVLIRPPASKTSLTTPYTTLAYRAKKEWAKTMPLNDVIELDADATDEILHQKLAILKAALSVPLDNA